MPHRTGFRLRHLFGLRFPCSASTPPCFLARTVKGARRTAWDNNREPTALPSTAYAAALAGKKATPRVPNPFGSKPPKGSASGKHQRAGGRADGRETHRHSGGRAQRWPQSTAHTTRQTVDGQPCACPAGGSAPSVPRTRPQPVRAATRRCNFSVFTQRRLYEPN
jgi:hypothetical protein